jgi:glycerol-3-phosphate acyltransferase PlsY
MAGNAAAAASCAAGYLIGSVPFGLIVGRAVGGLDVRDFGSGNMGTANVLRTVGARAGAITFALDVGKGAAAIGLARAWGADPTTQAAAGLAACVGHSWPVFARFRGGKAVATAFGAMVLVSPEAAAWATVGGIGALALSRTMSVGSLTATGTATFGAALENSPRVGAGDRPPRAEHPAHRARGGAEVDDAPVGQSSLSHQRRPANRSV